MDNSKKVTASDTKATEIIPGEGQEGLKDSEPCMATSEAEQIALLRRVIATLHSPPPVISCVNSNIHILEVAS